jgi:hypothetical protein
MPVVREQVLYDLPRQGPLPLAAARQLPLAATSGPGATPGPAPTSPAWSPAPMAHPGAAVAAGHGNSTNGVNGTRPPAQRAQAQTPTAVDVERIVDTVHRRFLQRLAVEGERRGVR